MSIFNCLFGRVARRGTLLPASLLFACAFTANAQVTYESERPGNVVSGSADIANCSVCSGGRNVQNLGGPRQGTIVFNNVQSSTGGTVLVSVIYDNGSSSAMRMAISVNGQAPVIGTFPSTGSWMKLATVSVPVTLNAGNNTIKLAGVSNGWAPEVDKIALQTSNVPTPTPTPTPTPSPAANSVSLSSFGSVGQGGNDTSVFQAALNATAKSGEQLVVPAGNYNTGTLNFPSGANVFMQAGVTVTATSGFSRGQHLVEINGSNISISGTPGKSIFQMRKSEYTDGSEYRHCMAIESGANKVVVDGISCNNAGGDGVYLNGATSTTIRNSTFDNNSRDAMSIISGNGLLVDNCTFSNTKGNPNGGSAPDGPWAGIDMEPNVTTDQLHDVTIQNSSFIGNSGDGILVTTGNLSSAAGVISITLNHLTSSGNNTSGKSGLGGYVFYNGLNHSPNNQTGSVLLENSTSTNDGGYGFEARFWDYSNPGVKLTVNNVTVTDPQKVLKGNTAFAVNGGGGDSAPAGNITFSNITVNYTNGYSLPYFFDCGPSNSGGMAVISITNVSGSGKSRTDGMGLLNGVPVNTVAVN